MDVAARDLRRGGLAREQDEAHEGDGREKREHAKDEGPGLGEEVDRIHALLVFLLFCTGTVVGVVLGVAVHELGHVLALLLSGRRDVEVWIWCKPATTPPVPGSGILWHLGGTPWRGGEVLLRGGGEPTDLPVAAWVSYCLGGAFAAGLVGTTLLVQGYPIGSGLGFGMLLPNGPVHLFPAGCLDGALCVSPIPRGGWKVFSTALLAVAAVVATVVVALKAIRGAG